MSTPAQAMQAQLMAATAPGVINYSKYLGVDFFTYELDFTTSIAGNGQATGTLQIQTDSDFFWTKSAYAQTGTGVPAILIQDTGSGRNLSTYAVPVINMFGTGQLPFILPRQRVFASNSTVNITISNLDSVNAISTLRLSFIGEKWFR